MHTWPLHAAPCRGRPQPWALPAPQGARDLWGPPPPSTPVPHQFHQHCLQLKKHASSYNICCICHFVRVTAGYVMAVLLSCLIYLVLIPLWSISTAMICTIIMTLLATVYLSLIEPWVPCVRQAQHTPRCQAAAMTKCWQDGQEPTAEPGDTVDGGDTEE
ncbi:uncharacterized protein LJ206_013167 [Theristicus caerulescens]